MTAPSIPEEKTLLSVDLQEAIHGFARHLTLLELALIGLTEGGSGGDPDYQEAVGYAMAALVAEFKTLQSQLVPEPEEG